MVEKAKVLIVQGDRAMCTMLELALTYNGKGFQVSTAPTGRSALLQLAIVRPDLILLDLTLPDGDGWETLDRIREISTVPVIALSSVNDPEITVRSLERGADYCLAQPWRTRELRARVRVLLRRENRPVRTARQEMADHL